MELGILALGFLFGASLGSFIKVIADRSLLKKNFRGRSYCEHCKKQIRWYDLFPIVSYLILSGRCRYCKKKIHFGYLATEVTAGLLFAYLIYQTFILSNFFDKELIAQGLILGDFLVKAFAISVFMAVFLTDIKKGLIPDKITYPAIIILFAILVIESILKIILLLFSLKDHPVGKFLLPPHSDYFFRHSLLAGESLTGGIIAAASLGLFFGLIIILTKGKGMGGGDLKLGIFMGLALGFSLSMLALMISFITGSIVGILLVALKKKKINQTIPFGPFLSLGGIAAVLFGSKLISWYVSISGLK